MLMKSREPMALYFYAANYLGLGVEVHDRRHRTRAEAGTDHARLVFGIGAAGDVACQDIFAAQPDAQAVIDGALGARHEYRFLDDLVIRGDWVNLQLYFCIRRFHISLLVKVRLKYA